MNDLAIQDKRSVEELKADVQLIQRVMASVMQKDVHYGVIPGCGKKPTLLKAGAEKIMSAFRLSVEPQIEDLSTSDEIRYRIKANISLPSGVFIGAGVGECSSNEEKYKWRAAVSKAEFDATMDDRKRIKYTYNGTINQVRTNPADVANTILKMAKKRALTDGILTCTACSDLFEQDMEDAGDTEQPRAIKPPVEMPVETQAAQPQAENWRPAAAGKLITDKQKKRLYAISKGKVDAEVMKLYLLETHGFHSSDEITMDKYEEICKWAEAGGEVNPIFPEFPEEEAPFA